MAVFQCAYKKGLEPALKNQLKRVSRLLQPLDNASTIGGMIEAGQKIGGTLKEAL